MYKHFSLLAALLTGSLLSALAAGTQMVNYETPHVHPLELTPDGTRLLAVNTAAGTLMVFRVDGSSVALERTIPVGVDPVTVRARTNTEAWVVNTISDSVSIVDLGSGTVQRTLLTEDEPRDVVFAGAGRAFVSCSGSRNVLVYDAVLPTAVVATVPIAGASPRALAVSADGRRVYVAIFESGNGTTLVIGGKDVARYTDAVRDKRGPYGGKAVPPNAGNAFQPPINSSLPTPPPVSMIVRKSDQGKWLDDNGGDWTRLVSGDLAKVSSRVPGWDLPDRDVAMIDTTTLAVSYQPRLMNIVMAIAVNPATQRVSVVGTDALNQIRYEPNLRGRFLRVNVADFAAAGGDAKIRDLNPHLDYKASRVDVLLREQSLGDPRGIAWEGSGQRAFVTGMGSNNVVVIDPNGARLARVNVGEGPTGIVLQEARGRAFVLNKFDGSISTLALASVTETARTPFADPTTVNIKIGRRQLYDTHAGSGLGHISCASCHVDGKTDRLAWDLGDPTGVLERLNGATFHPMKGPMKTQSLQDIIGSPALHHRGDKADLLGFASSFATLQGNAASAGADEIEELEKMLDTLHYPPNPNRNIDNTLSTTVKIPGPNRTVRQIGNARAGVGEFTCVNCHQGARTRSRNFSNNGITLNQSTTPETFSALYSRIGFFGGSKDGSLSGFGLRPDGAQSTEFFTGSGTSDTLVDKPNVFAYMLSIEGPLIGRPGPGRQSHAGVGQQLTLRPDASATERARLTQLVSIAETTDIALVASTVVQGRTRSYLFRRGGVFLSDRGTEQTTVNGLITQSASSPVTFTLVPSSTAQLLSIDRDADGILDGDDAQPQTRNSLARVAESVNLTSGVALAADITATAEKSGEYFLNGVRLGATTKWQTPLAARGAALREGLNTLAIRATTSGSTAGALAEISVGGQRLVSSSAWKISLAAPTGWQSADFDDSTWSDAMEYAPYGEGSWGKGVSGFPGDSRARWLWSHTITNSPTVFLRFTFRVTAAELPAPIRPPTITAIAAQTTLRGAATALQVSASDPAGRTLKYSASGLPKGLVIDPTTGRISGTVALDAAATNAVTIAADNGSLVAATTFSWTITDSVPVSFAFSEDFNAASLDGAKWTLGSLYTLAFGGPVDPAIGIVQKDGALQITPRANYTGEGYRGVVSSATVDLRGASVAAQVTPAGGGADTWFALFSGNNGLVIGREGASLWLEQTSGGVRNYTIAPFDPAQRFWRIRHDAATDALLYQLSGDGFAWATARTVARGIDVSALRIELAAGTYQVEAAPGVATFDNIRFVASSLPAAWDGNEIGSPALKGTDGFANSVFTISGGGAGFTGTADSGHFTSQTLSGNGEIVARVASQSTTNALAKAGVMIRDTHDPKSRMTLLSVTQGDAIHFQSRATTGAAATQVSAPRGNLWLRLTRNGSTITASRSENGSAWTQVGTIQVAFGKTISIGLAVTASADGLRSTATFDSVKVTLAP